MAEVVVLDASALIALASSKDPHHQWALEMFRDTASFDLQITALSHAEALVHPAKHGKLDRFQKLVSGLGLEVCPIETEVTGELASLGATTSLKILDVCVLYQAMKLNGSIATTDKELAKAAKSKGVGVFAPKV